MTSAPVVLLYHTATGLWHWNAVLAALVLETAAVVVEWQCCRATRTNVSRETPHFFFVQNFRSRYTVTPAAAPTRSQGRYRSARVAATSPGPGMMASLDRRRGDLRLGPPGGPLPDL